jgi:HK97 family phage prohead protease
MAKVGGEEINLTPTDGMASEAQRSLDWRTEGFDGGTPVGLARARQLVNKQELSPRTVRRMHSFFSRHEVDKQAEGFSPGEEGYPSNGRVAWGLWGGDAGQTWARAKSKTLDRLEGKSIDYTKDMHYDEEDDDYKDEVHYSAGPKDLKTGDFVRWNSSGGTAKGRIEHVMREGVLGIPDSSFSINATEEDPAALIRIYRDGAETDTLVGHKFSTLTKITQEEALKGYRGTKMIFKLDSSIKSIEEGDAELKISGYASTDSIDRASDRILPTAWTRGGLRNYEINPILLFNHDYNRPIGKVVEITTDSRGLKIKGIISKSAGDVYNLVKEGVLSTFSVGFLVKDADYDKSLDGLIVKDAELLEVSVVSVPANQDATFSLAKSFDNQDDYLNFKKQFINGGANEADTEGTQKVSRKLKMDETTQDLINKAVADALAANQKAADEKAAKEASEKAAGEALEKKVAEAAAKVIATSEERIAAELEKRFADKEVDLTKALDGLRGELAEKSAELSAITNSKRVFSDRGDSKAEWKKNFATDIEDAYLLARVTGKGYETKFAKSLMEKVNAHSSVQVSSADFEQEVSTNIERDIQNELILAPMFREVAMNTSSMIMPIMPDSGYAEITSAAGSTDGVSPNGTLDTRGGTNRGGIALTEIELRTIKMVAKSYLGNETEEDAIMPILPLLREAMIRQHARGVENMILLAGHADGAYSSLTAAQGLLKYASTQSRDLDTGTAGTLPALTAAGLLGLRKNMGKYGLRATDVSYIVSQRAYFELLEDPEFQDFNLVNQMATKMTGEVGQVFGSPVMMCDEFPDSAAGKYYALAVNTRNFVIPRQRGVTVESDYLVEEQHRVLVTSQRLGFKEIIPNAKSVFGFKYPAAGG